LVGGGGGHMVQRKWEHKGKRNNLGRKKENKMSGKKTGVLVVKTKAKWGKRDRRNRGNERRKETGKFITKGEK